MKILLSADPFIPVPPAHYGGIERIIDSLVTEFRKRGITVGLVAHSESTCESDAFFPWSDTAPPNAWRIHCQSLRQAARLFNPDVLHSFSRLSYLAPLMFSPYPKIMSYQRATGGRNITAFNSLIRNLHFTGCSEHICQQGRSAGGHWTPIHNFVAIEKFDYVAQVPADAPLVFLSRMEAIKGAHRAIQIARTAGKPLILAGNRVDTPVGIQYWKEKIEPELDGTQIKYIGEVDDQKKNKLLGSASALLVPIEWDEPFGIVFAEALACGTPVISSPRGALPEIITSGKHGFLINSQREGVDAIHRLHRINRKACRTHCEAFFTSSVVATQYIHLYQQVLNS
ncbi:MAG: glycosyltransferase [Verrucomicrobiota bacterium]